jgi:hypothetical protein
MPRLTNSESGPPQKRHLASVIITLEFSFQQIALEMAVLPPDKLTLKYHA